MSVERNKVYADRDVMAEWATHIIPKTEADGLTCPELAKMAGIGQSWMRQQLREGVLNGTYLCGLATRTSSVGYPVRVPVYWLAKKPTKKKR
jgi:hypothetical protein